MGLLTNIMTYFDTRRLNRLEADIRMINERFAFNPWKVGLPSALRHKLGVSHRLIENFVWFSANSRAIQEFYQNISNDERIDEPSFFWATAPESIRRIHTGLPSLISDKMAVVLFGSGINYALSVYPDGAMEANEAISNQAKSMADLLMSKEGIELSKKVDTAAIKESWSGHVAFKLSYDPTISSAPILEVYDKRSFEVVQKRGITIAIVFKNYHEIAEGENGRTRKYEHQEIYTTEADKTSLIINQLWEQLPNGKSVQVPLTTIEQTGALLEIEGVIEEGLDAKFRLEGLTGILAFDKPNKLGTSEFDDSPYGLSDFAGNYANFDALDEVVSAIVGEIRDNKTIRYIPEDMIPRDSDSGKLLKFDKYVTNHIKVQHDPDQNAKNEITFSEFTDKTVQHMEKYKTTIGLACTMSGLSPLSLGITDFAAMNNSDKTLAERSKVTLETRKRKLELWKPFLQRVVLKTLEMYSWMKKKGLSGDDGIPYVDIDYKNTDVLVSFGEYIEKGIEDRLVTWGDAFVKGTTSYEMFVEKVYGDDLSDTDKQIEVSRLKFKAGMSDDNPMLLQLNVPSAIDEAVTNAQETTTGNT